MLKTAVSGPPVTVPAGFPGADRNTLPRRIPADQDGLRVAVIAHGMSDADVDASLTGKSAANAGAAQPRTEEKMVATRNGCIDGCVCCFRRENLLLTVRKPAAHGRLDGLLIESMSDFTDEDGVSLNLTHRDGWDALSPRRHALLSNA